MRKVIFSILAVVIVLLGVNYAAELAWDPGSNANDAAVDAALAAMHHTTAR